MSELKTVLKSWEDGLEDAKDLPYNELHSEVFAYHHPKTKTHFKMDKPKVTKAYKKYKEIFEE